MADQQLSQIKWKETPSGIILPDYTIPSWVFAVDDATFESPKGTGTTILGCRHAEYELLEECLGDGIPSDFFPHGREFTKPHFFQHMILGLNRCLLNVPSVTGWARIAAPELKGINVRRSKESVRSYMKEISCVPSGASFNAQAFEYAYMVTYLAYVIERHLKASVSELVEARLARAPGFSEGVTARVRISGESKVIGIEEFVNTFWNWFLMKAPKSRVLPRIQASVVKHRDSRVLQCADVIANLLGSLVRVVAWESGVTRDCPSNTTRRKAEVFRCLTTADELQSLVTSGEIVVANENGDGLQWVDAVHDPLLSMILVPRL